MNKDNIKLLQDTLKYLGFGENTLLSDELEETIALEPPHFQLFTEAYYEEKYIMELSLSFRRSNQSDWYFFNYYEALLKVEGEPEKTRQQIFYINKGSGITLKEAFNLLQGRAVFKRKLVDAEGREYDAWVQLNFEEKEANNNYSVKKYGLWYGYDLEKILTRYPIRELKHPDQREALLRSLYKGNLHLVNFEKTYGPEKMYVSANPQYKTLNIVPTSVYKLQKADRRKMATMMEGPDPSDQEPENAEHEQLEENKETGEDKPLNAPAEGEEMGEAEKKPSPDTEKPDAEGKDNDEHEEEEEEEPEAAEMPGVSKRVALRKRITADKSAPGRSVGIIRTKRQVIKGDRKLC